MQEAGQLIRAAREKEHLSVEQFAAENKTDPETIRKIEDGSIEEIGIRQLSWMLLPLGLRITITQEPPPPTWEELQARNKKQRMKALKTADEIIAKKLSVL